jgi:hypothetical protein
MLFCRLIGCLVHVFDAAAIGAGFRHADNTPGPNIREGGKVMVPGPLIEAGYQF